MCVFFILEGNIIQPCPDILFSYIWTTFTIFVIGSFYVIAISLDYRGVENIKWHYSAGCPAALGLVCFLVRVDDKIVKKNSVKIHRDTAEMTENFSQYVRFGLIQCEKRLCRWLFYCLLADYQSMVGEVVNAEKLSRKATLEYNMRIM